MRSLEQIKRDDPRPSLLAPTWRPILFSSEMVLAILAGTKTVTRRIVKPQPKLSSTGSVHRKAEYEWSSNKARTMVELGEMGGLSPYGGQFTRLWVRETWCLASHESFCEGIPTELEDGRPRGPAYEDSECQSFAFYKATDRDITLGLDEEASPWKPSIHMPKWASRISLEIESIRVERLLDITDEDARHEGVRPFFAEYDNIGRDQHITTGELARDAEYRASFAVLWDKINGHRALWKSNPFVWRVAFRRISDRPPLGAP